MSEPVLFLGYELPEGRGGSCVSLGKLLNPSEHLASSPVPTTGLGTQDTDSGLH